MKEEKITIVLLIAFILFLTFKLHKVNNEVNKLLREKIDFVQKKLPQSLDSLDKRIVIDNKFFTDTLDISDNFFVFEHTSEIIQLRDSEFESFLRDFDQVKSEYGNDFFVRTITFYNGKSLPLETENSNTDIYILIQPTELGYQNKMFVISDFHDVDLISLVGKGNTVELKFVHGKYPRKMETIIIKPESVKFKNE
jgi:hypothetical protein